MRRRRTSAAWAALLVLTVAGRAGFAAPIELADIIHEPVPTSDANFGRAVVAADFDGDGTDDLAVGAVGQGAGQANFAGEVTVFRTGGGGPVTLYSSQPETAPAFGRTLAAGDIDGDGLKDLVVGSPHAAVGTVIHAGEVSVFFGPDFVRVTHLHDPAPQSSAAFGISVAAGDMNGDGFDDVVAGAWDSNVGAFMKAGEAFVFTGPSLLQVTTLRSPEPELVADFGVASAIGDVDGDGFGDVIVGSWIADVTPNGDDGKVFVFHGPALTDSDKLIEGGAGRRLGQALATGDVDGDGIDEIIAGASSGAVLFKYIAPDSYAREVRLRVGGVEAVSVRDANGDGFADVLAGSPDADDPSTDTGGATLLLGPNLTQSWDLTMVETQAGAEAGTGVAIGGYPDGVSTLFVSSPFLDVPGANGAGAVFLAAVDDPDHDAWLSQYDNCPLIANPEQQNTDAASLDNGPILSGDDVTIAMEDVLGDACDGDDDNDGITDADEGTGAACAGIVTNALLMDTDGDHLTDGWECANGSDPTNPASKALGSGAADADGDRVPDLWEQRGYGTSGSSTDSDADGCHDMVEVASIDGNKTVGDADRLSVARRALNIWPPEVNQDYVLDIDKNGTVGDSDRLFVARAALLPAWVPKSCP